MAITTLGFHWYNNGTTNLFLPNGATIPQDFVKGKLKSSSELKEKLSLAHKKKKMHWYNNGVVQIQKSACPEGFKPGRLPLTEAAREKMRLHHGGGRKLGSNKETNPNYSQTEKTRHKISDSLSGHSVKEDTRQKIKYGVSSKECQTKRNLTMRKNNSFNISKDEQKFLDELLKYFKINDIYTQYVDIRYPFKCDFYIKSLDTFIELNHSWTHGGHQFNEQNLYDLNKLSEWSERSKNSNYYKNAIETWTVRDIKKFNIAKTNNLNYLVSYNNADLKDIIDILLKKESV